MNNCRHGFGDMISAHHTGWPGDHIKSKRCGKCGLSEMMYNFIKPINSDTPESHDDSGVNSETDQNPSTNSVSATDGDLTVDELRETHVEARFKGELHHIFKRSNETA